MYRFVITFALAITIQEKEVIMKRWICSECGYAHYGEEAPDRCPQCGALRFQFYLSGKKGRNWNTVIMLCVIATMLAVILINLVACKSAHTVDSTAVKEVDMSRYLGKWYEIARFDHLFERGMTHCTATYSMRDDGYIEVANRGKKNGKWKSSTGKAKKTDMSGVLRVSFFGPFYSDYRILMLAPDYSYALIGGDNDGYLWILSRTPQLEQSTKDMLIREAQRRGYNTDKLIWVEQ